MKRALLLIPFLLSSCGTPENIVPETKQERKMFAFLEKFDRFDYNGDGKLTKKEVHLGLKESEVPGITLSEIDRAFDKYDLNGDGAISFAEAQAGMRRHFRDRAPAAE